MNQKLQLPKILLVLTILLITFTACKKDALKVDVEKNYTEQKSTPATDLASGPMHLSLKPEGIAISILVETSCGEALQIGQHMRFLCAVL